MLAYDNVRIIFCINQIKHSDILKDVRMLFFKNLSSLESGNFIGEIAFQRYFILGMKEATRTATVRAITEVTLVPISGDIFEGLYKLISSTPGLFLRLFTQAVKREDALINEVDSLKGAVKKFQEQNNQIKKQIIDFRKSVKVLMEE